MPFIFLSYSHKDSEYANRLADSLANLAGAGAGLQGGHYPDSPPLCLAAILELARENKRTQCEGDCEE